MLPKLFHPSNFCLYSINYLLASIRFSLREFEHIFIILEFLQVFLQIVYVLVNLIDLFKAICWACLIEINWLFFEVILKLFQLFFKFFYLFFCSSSFNCFGPSDLLFNPGGDMGNSFCILHEFVNFFSFSLFFLIIFPIKGLQYFFDSVKSQD